MGPLGSLSEDQGLLGKEAGTSISSREMPHARLRGRYLRAWPAFGDHAGWGERQAEKGAGMRFSNVLMDPGCCGESNNKIILCS